MQKYSKEQVRNATIAPRCRGNSFELPPAEACAAAPSSAWNLAYDDSAETVVAGAMLDAASSMSKFGKRLVVCTLLIVALLSPAAFRFYHRHYGGEIVGSSTSPDGAYKLEIHELEHLITFSTRVPYVLRVDLMKSGRRIARGAFDIVCDGPAWWEMMLFVTWQEDGALVDGLGIGEPDAVLAGYDGSVTAIMEDGSTQPLS